MMRNTTIFIVYQMESDQRKAAFGIPFAVHLSSKNISTLMQNCEFNMNYVICRNRAEYITVMSLITVIAYTVFSSIHLDYDKNVDRLWKKVNIAKKSD